MPDANSHAHLWFLDTLVTVRTSQADGQDGIVILEHRAPSGDSPPLLVHRTEDEILQILEGKFRFRVGGAERWAGPGASGRIGLGTTDPGSPRERSKERVRDPLTSLCTDGTFLPPAERSSR